MADSNYTTYSSSKSSKSGSSTALNVNPQMQGTKKIVITLKVAGGTQEDKEENKKQQEAKERLEKQNEQKISTGKKLESFVWQETVNVAEYFINRTLELNDDYIGQRQYAIAKQALSFGTSIAKNMVSWGSGLSLFGPIGVAVGATLGAATTIISTQIEATKAADQQNIQLKRMETQLDYTRQRAGWSTTAASIGEDL